MKEKFMQLLHEEDGATAVEYGVLVALIIAVCVVVIKALGNKINDAFEAVNSKLPATPAAGTGTGTGTGGG